MVQPYAGLVPVLDHVIPTGVERRTEPDHAIQTRDEVVAGSTHAIQGRDELVAGSAHAIQPGADLVPRETHVVFLASRLAASLEEPERFVGGKLGEAPAWFSTLTPSRGRKVFLRDAKHLLGFVD